MIWISSRPAAFRATARVFSREKPPFKTPSTADVLILELVTVCCFCVSGLNSLPSPSAAVHIERSHVVQVSSLVLFFTPHFVPRSPFGRRAVRQRGYGLRLLIFKMANNKVDLGQIRSEEIVYSKFIKIPLG